MQFTKWDMDPTFKETYSMLHWHYSKPLSQNIVLWAIVENKRRREQSYVNILSYSYIKTSWALSVAVSRGEGPTYGALGAATVTVGIRSMRSGRHLFQVDLCFWRERYCPCKSYLQCMSYTMNKAFKVSNACVELGRLTSHHVGIQATKN